MTVIGSRTRRTGILTVPCGFSPVGVGLGEGFGLCAKPTTAAPVTITATDKYLNKNRVRPTDMRYGLSSGADRSLLETGDSMLSIPNLLPFLTLGVVINRVLKCARTA